MGGKVDEDPKERFRRTIRFTDLACDPVYLGGDLHAVHPGSRDPGGVTDRDESLDLATVSLLDGEGWPLEVPAADGVWCTRLE